LLLRRNKTTSKLRAAKATTLRPDLDNTSEGKQGPSGETKRKGYLGSSRFRAGLFDLTPAW
jgi:hypothetical protein